MLDGFEHTPRERAIAELLVGQHGVVALGQLVALGLSASAVRSRVASGRLQRVHRGVLSAGGSRLTRRGRIMAAVLAGTPGTVASHRSAAALHGLRLRAPSAVDVTAPGSRSSRRAGIVVHSGATLLARDVGLVDAIPCTTLARTLLDVAEDATRRELELACGRAAELRLLDMTALDDVLARADGRRGAARLADVVRDHAATSSLTRSELEERLLALARSAGVAPDDVNAWLPFPAGGGAEADFLWRRERLVVEVDGREAHATPRAFEADRRRDQQLALLGWRVVRFTWRQVAHEPAQVAATLLGLLGRR